MRPANSGSLREVETGNDMRSAKSNLLGLGEEIVRVAIQGPFFPTGVTGTSSSGTILVASSTSKLKRLGLFLCEYLQAEFVFRDRPPIQLPPTGRAGESPGLRPKS